MLKNKIIIIFSFFGMIQFCTVRIPSVTFTETPTAAERQMVGTDKNLERDGWILSSVRTSASGSEIWEKEVLDDTFSDKNLTPEIMASLRRIAYLSAELREYRKKGFVGETLEGKAGVNPRWKESRDASDFEKSKERINDVLVLMNESRETVYNKKIELLQSEKLSPPDFESRKRQILLRYYSMTEEGEYFESAKGKWTIRQ